MTLHQFLEARLDLGRLRIDLESQRVEGLALRVAHLPRLLRGFLCVGASAATPEFAQHVKRIVRRARCEIVDATVEAHLPGRPMAGHCILLIARDRVLAHSGKVVVGAVVLAHMHQAETPVLVLTQPPLGRAMRRLAGAARPLAGRYGAGRLALLLGLYPDAIE